MRPLHAALAAAALFLTAPLGAQEWAQHSMERPAPTVVHPGGAAVIAPPADAVVLFDGRSLEQWVSARDSSGARWKIVGNALEVVPGTGGIHTAAGFGSVQLHVEWMTPAPPSGDGQDRGNSGVFLMGRYEVQVLDSWENRTYADGQAGAIYGQVPPMVDASLPPGTWQSFDILFRRPLFDAAGKVTRPARMTVFHNGVLVHHEVALVGPTSHQVRAPYEAHADRLPLALQDHGVPVRFRNIWIRPLPERP
jgi:hypothetical protein